tara:strand:+ start:431 stop:685 length:255 start_codon:yes stop_codon:yes gene_type:complete
VAYYYRDGREYKGEVCILPDGRVITGPTYTSESQRLVTEPPVIEQAKRARNEDGGFIADDKSTDGINEAWVGGKAPAKKKRGKK